MSYNNLPTDIADMIMKIRYDLMIEDKKIRLQQHQKQLNQIVWIPYSHVTPTLVTPTHVTPTHVTPTQ